MIELKHCVLSELAIVNSLTGQLSIINLINGVTLPGLPQDVNTLFLVMSWQRDRDEKSKESTFFMRVILEHEDEPQNPDRISDIEITMPKGEYIVNTVLNMSLKLSKPGENKLVIQKKSEDNEWERVGTASLEVTVQEHKQ